MTITRQDTGRLHATRRATTAPGANSTRPSDTGDVSAPVRCGYRVELMSQYFAALFSRRPNDGWFRVSRYDVTTVDILTALAIASMFVKAFSDQAFFQLVFEASSVRGGQIWRLVTWPIAEIPGFFALISIAFFWSFGQQVEGLMGRNKFLFWVSSVAVVPAISLTLLGLVNQTFDFTSVSFGLGPLFLAGIWLYAATYPNVRWFDVIPLWAIAAVFTLLQLLQFGDNGASGAILFLLISIAAALSAGRSLGFATAWPIPHIPLGPGSGGRRKPKRSKPSPPKRPKRGGAGQRVVEGPWRREPEASTPKVVPPTGPSPADQAEMDGLLDKIQENGGIDALSGAEKQRLNELSKRLRNK